MARFLARHFKFVHKNWFINRYTINKTLRNMSIRYYDRSGNSMTKNEYLSAVSQNNFDVLFIGENHSNPESHKIELEVLEMLFKRENKKSVVLSLEFFDREAQLVMDEYLRGDISEDSFLRDSRPPHNYNDYLPLLHFCLRNKIPMIASNCPRRYSRTVSKEGKDILDHLAKLGASHLLPPIPYKDPSVEYKKEFYGIMGQTDCQAEAISSLDKMIEAQALWDATMAHSIHQHLTKEDNSVILHLSGYFHIKNNLGIIEYLQDFNPDAKFLTTIILPEEKTTKFNADHKNISDFIIFTDLANI